MGEQGCVPAVSIGADVGPCLPRHHGHGAAWTVLPGWSSSEDMGAIAPDMGRRCRDHPGGQPRDPAGDNGRQANLGGGKRSGWRIDEKTDEQPSDRP